MPKVPEVTGLMVDPAGARQGRFEYAPTKSDQTAQKYFADAADKAVTLGARIEREKTVEEEKAKRKAEIEAKKARDEMARARAAELAQRYTLEGKALLTGQGGALLKTGKNVVEGENGMSFSQANSAKLDDLRNSILSEVDDPDVRRYAESSIRSVESTYKGALITHEGTEGYKYIQTMRQNAVNLSADDALADPNPGTIGAWEKQAKGLARFNGQDVNDPYFKATMKRASGEFYVKAVSARLASGDVEGARRLYLTAVEDRGRLSLRQLIDLEAPIREAERLKTATFTGQAVAKQAAANHDPMRALFSAVAGNPKEEAPRTWFDNAGLDYDKLSAQGYGTNPEFTEAVNAELFNKITETAGTTEEAVGVLLFGRERVDSAIELAAKRDKNAGMWQNYLTDDERNRIKSAQTKFRYNAGVGTSVTESEVRRLVDARLPGADEDTKNAAVAVAMEQVNANAIRARQDRENAISDIVGMIDGGGELSDTRMAAYNGVLSMSDRAAIQSLRLRQATGDTTTDPARYAKLMSSPARVAQMSDGDLQLTRAYLGPQEFAMLARYRQQLQGIKDFSQIDTPRDQVKSAVLQWARTADPDLAKNDEDSVTRLENTVDYVYAKVLSVQAEQAGTLSGKGGVKFSSTELRDTVFATLNATFQKPEGVIFRTASRKNISMLERKDISPRLANLMTDMLIQKGVMTPTDGAVVNMVRMISNMPGDAPFAEVVLDPKYKQSVQAVKKTYARAYAKANGVSEDEGMRVADRMSPTAIVRYIIRFELDGDNSYMDVIQDNYRAAAEKINIDFSGDSDLSNFGY